MAGMEAVLASNDLWLEKMQFSPLHRMNMSFGVLPISLKFLVFKSQK
jgi:hypothetical protein